MIGQYDNSKPFYLSLTFWGLVMTMIASLLKKFEFEVDAEWANEAAQFALDATQMVVGPLLALIGRVRATKPLSIGGGSSMLAVVLFALMLPLMSGCGSRAELIAYREGVHAGTSTLRSEHLEWARAIAGAEGYQLPDVATLTPEQRQSWLRARERVHEQYDELVGESRGKDTTVFRLFGQ